MEDMDVSTIGTMPSDDFSTPPEPQALADKHVYLAHGQSEEAIKWARQIRGCLTNDGYVVDDGSAEPGSRRTPTEQRITKIKKCVKVVMLIDREYLNTAEYREALSLVEKMTAERKREILIPVLSRMEYKDLPPELQIGSAVPVIGPTGDYLKAAEQTWARLTELLAREVPVLSTVTNGVAYGLAWGYFFGYLHLILQGLSDRMRQAFDSTERHDWDCTESPELFTRMVAIIPESVTVQSSLSQYDPNIEVVKSRTNGEPIKVKHTIDFPGHPKRDYSCTMFKTTVNGKEYLFFAEVPLTLNTLAKMRDSDVVEFSEDDHKRELTRFQASLEGILTTHRDDHSQARANSIKILQFGERGESLSQIISREIEIMLAWERTPWKFNSA